MSVAHAPPNTAAAFKAALDATDQQMADLAAYRELLIEWNEKMNLVGPSAMPVFWSRHVYDSAQLLAIAPTAGRWADLGAGAGFPGLILAILLKGSPGAKVHLVESQAKRCRFLSEVAHRLALPAQVHNDRAENLSLTVDIVTARACAPLPRLLGYAKPYFKAGAIGLFLKGQDVEAELSEASKHWKFHVELLPSSSSPDGRVVRIKGLSRV